jgi:hypothetical protein
MPIIIIAAVVGILYLSYESGQGIGNAETVIAQGVSTGLEVGIVIAVAGLFLWLLYR